MDYLFLGALTLLLVIDWLQTLTIVRNPRRWYERNPLLQCLLQRFPRAEHEAVVHCWFTTGVLIATILSIAGWWPLTGLWMLAEIYCVVTNHFKGIRPTGW